MHKQSFDFKTPIMNASGSLGFSPDLRGSIDLEKLGAFITNPVSMRKRKATKGTRLINYPGGALLHTGHPNPGLKSVLKNHRSRWAHASLPVIVHLLGASPQEMEEMMLLLEEVDSVGGVEVGLPQEVDAQTAISIVEAAVGELPLMVRVPMSKAALIGRAAFQAGASMISIGPPRGALTEPNGEKIYGRLYGPAIFPHALEAVSSLVKLNIPVVGGGGVYAMGQMETMLAAGAVAVQLDTVLWRGDFFDPEKGKDEK